MSFWSDDKPKVVRPDRVYFYAPGLRKYASNQVLGSFVAWLDFDDVTELDQRKFHIKPSLIISTGGGFHIIFQV